MNNNSGLSSIYRRISKNCCSEWENSSVAFREWYQEKYNQQQGRCIYCNLPGDTIDHYGHYFRGGRRGKRLEVDRMISDQPYSPENCVLACYPCNNAKSDVFSYKEFLEIGRVINKIKTKVK